MTEPAPQRWAPDRYRQTADYLFPASVATVAAVDAMAGDLVIDSGTGTGNAALAATDRGFRVVGVDISSSQISEARRRLAGRDATFHVADAQHLPLPTAGAAAGISVFGIIFASEPPRALAELGRCVRPGGTVAFTCLTVGGWPSAARELLADELGSVPPPFPSLWSTRELVIPAAETAGLQAVRVSSEELRLALDPGLGLADQVSSRMGVLAAQRRALEEAGGWAEAEKRLDLLLAGHVREFGSTPALVDEYLVVHGTRGRLT